MSAPGSVFPTDAPLVVFDCETTGLGKHDRVVEIAAVTLDPRSGEIVDEYDTLINPQRDVGPTSIHGITASMVQAAPVFPDVVAALARRMNNSVLVAHNISFDQRLLGYEFERIGAPIDWGRGICTYRLSGEKLIAVCDRFGIALQDQHRALADARATAALLRVFAEDLNADELVPAQLGYIAQSLNTRTLRRTSSPGQESGMARVVSHTRYPFSDEAILHYLDALDWVLDDHEIDEQERVAMHELAVSYGLSAQTVEEAHRSYLSAIIAAAERDGYVSREEEVLI